MSLLLFCVLYQFVRVSIFVVDYWIKFDIYICRKRLKEQCKLVLEENELLMEQLNVQQQKHNEQRKMHVCEGRQFLTVLVNHFYLLCIHLL